MGEGILDYLIAFIFGEYKQSNYISDKLEAEFYRNTNRQVSAGVKVSFIRILSTQFSDSILSEKLNSKNKYLSAGNFAPVSASTVAMQWHVISRRYAGGCLPDKLLGITIHKL